MDPGLLLDKGSERSSHQEIEFDPLCKWQREEEKDTLEIKLFPGTEKKNLKICITNEGKLIISGKGLLDRDTDTWCRFQKTIDALKDYNVDEINAKFSQVTLVLNLPKKIPSVSTDHGDSTWKKTLAGGYVVISSLCMLGKTPSSRKQTLISRPMLEKKKKIAMGVVLVAISLAVAALAFFQLSKDLKWK